MAGANDKMLKALELRQGFNDKMVQDYLLI